MTPKYCIWRPTSTDPWRVYGTRRYYLPNKIDLPVVAHRIVPWVGDDYHHALRECRRLNADRR